MLLDWVKPCWRDSEQNAHQMLVKNTGKINAGSHTEELVAFLFLKAAQYLCKVAERRLPLTEGLVLLLGCGLLSHRQVQVITLRWKERIPSAISLPTW